MIFSLALRLLCEGACGPQVIAEHLSRKRLALLALLAAGAWTLGGGGGGAMAFTPGVLAFTRVITADVTGIQLGSSYTVYAEALNGAADPAQFNNALTSLCRNAMTDADWPAWPPCVAPAVDITFTTRTRAGP